MITARGWSLCAIGVVAAATMLGCGGSDPASNGSEDVVEGDESAVDAKNFVPLNNVAGVYDPGFGPRWKVAPKGRCIAGVSRLRREMEGREGTLRAGVYDPNYGVQWKIAPRGSCVGGIYDRDYGVEWKTAPL